MNNYFDTKYRWVLVFSLIVVVITSLPYVAAFANQGDDWVFTGFVLGVEDGNSYIAKMHTGAAGAWHFELSYTSVPQNGMIIFLPYIYLGKFANSPGIHTQLVIIFHLFRIISIILVSFAVYDFIAYFVIEEALRRWGLILAMLASGLGWILPFINLQNLIGNNIVYGIPGENLGLSFFSPEAFGFLALYTLPHIVLARALLFWGLKAYLQLVSQPINEPFPWKKGFIAGLLWLATGFAQPLSMMVIGGIAGFYLLFLCIWQIYLHFKRQSTSWDKLKRIFLTTIWIGVVPLPFVLYNVIKFRLDPVLRLWNEQSPLPSPHPLYYLIAYGLLLPFAVLGGIRLLKYKPWRGWLLVGWVLAFPFFVYSPFNMQRRLGEGIWIALITLALVSISPAYSNRVTINRRVLFGFCVITSLGFIAPLMLIRGGIDVALNPAMPAFRTIDEVKVFNFLEKNADYGNVVLSAYATGNAVPAWAPIRVVIGHGPESVGFNKLLPQVKEFYNTELTDLYRQQKLNQWNVDYVFWGPDERALGGWDPNQTEFLEKVYSAGEYELFQR